MGLLVKSKRQVGGGHGSRRTVVSYRLFGVVTVFRRSRPSRSGYGVPLMDDLPDQASAKD